MTPREEDICRFLLRAGWGAATRTPLAGDASARRYVRLSHPAFGPAVLMDADIANGEDVAPFVRIARHLTTNGFSAPEILAQDQQNGLLLLEDLGDALFARIAAADPTAEEPLYRTATECLFALHRITPPDGLRRADPDQLARMIRPVLDWYAKGAGRPASEDDTARLVGTMNTALNRHVGAPDVMILRDFHAENLLWLPERRGLARVGLLDFQDAMLGHPAYDLMSLTQDARRDTAPGLEETLMTQYIALSGKDRDEFAAQFAVLGAQRNLRIIGIFARLNAVSGKARYLDLIPRVWGHLMRDLAHPALTDLNRQVQRLLPPPDPAILTRLRGT